MFSSIFFREHLIELFLLHFGAVLGGDGGELFGIFLHPNHLWKRGGRGECECEGGAGERESLR